MSFNHQAAAENKANREHVRFTNNGNVSIDGKKATFQGVPVNQLNAVGRRKFENIVLLSNMDKAKGGLPKIHYQN